MRLTQALETLTQESPRSRAIVTVAELCRLANVSRNALYRYHPRILEAIHQHQRARTAIRSKYRAAAKRYREINIDLRETLANLAALVDHYYTAYRETTALLEHRDRDLAELRGKLLSRPALLSSVSRTARSR
jgi:AcrR family transcriptional regulator